MLAVRTRLRWGIAISAILTLAGLLASTSADVQQPAVPAPRIDPTPQVESGRPSRCGRVTPRSSDTLFVVLHEAPEWTGVDEESDWAKSYRMVWDGPIQTWTTMRKVRVPSLDHRMIESIEPATSIFSPGHAVFVRVRVVAPGDLEAALAWVRARPDVERASVRIDFSRPW